MTDMSTDVGALRSDARIWDRATTDLQSPRSAIKGLRLNGAHDVTGAGARKGVDTAYDGVRTQLERLLGQAQQSFRDLADKLDHVATEYEKQEKDHAGAVKETMS